MIFLMGLIIHMIFIESQKGSIRLINGKQVIYGHSFCILHFL